MHSHDRYKTGKSRLVGKLDVDRDRRVPVGLLQSIQTSLHAGGPRERLDVHAKLLVMRS